jgi:tRNA A-37 threonylcarbamoyl transferase component Bud32
LFEKVREQLRDQVSAYFPTDKKSRHACLKKFRSLRILGEGGFGTVYTTLREGHRYAVKVVTVNPMSPVKNYSNILTEIDITRRMGKMGVGLPLHEVHWCEEKETVVVMMVMDLAEHGDLDAFQRDHVLTEAHMGVIRAKVERMHADGICHRDLHSGNVLVAEAADGGFDFFISDFGFAQQLTPRCMANDTRHLHDLEQDITITYLQNVLMDMIVSGEVPLDLGSRVSSSGKGKPKKCIDAHSHASAVAGLLSPTAKPFPSAAPQSRPRASDKIADKVPDKTPFVSIASLRSAVSKGSGERGAKSLNPGAKDARKKRSVTDRPPKS